MSTNFDEPGRPHADETTGNKTMRKMKENPFVPFGMAGFFIMAFYGFRNFKSRPSTMTPSMYIMRFRVFAQSVAVGSMGLGIGYSILKEQFFPKKPDQEPSPGKSKKQNGNGRG